MPGRPHHSDKWHSCVDKLMAKGKDEQSASAICTQSLKDAGEPIFEGAERKNNVLNWFQPEGRAAGAYSMIGDQSKKKKRKKAKPSGSPQAYEGARELVLRGATGSVRTEMFDGREHIVVPVIALMEGVIHAVNAPEPEFVPMKALASSVHQWNGRPVVVYHPTKAGVQISANDPRVLEQHRIGTIFGTKMNGMRLCMEAWIDPERLKALGEHALLDRVRKGEPIEVSVGAFVYASPEVGSYNGKSYKARWTGLSSDHLAFLPTKKGACSIEMGCGAHRAAEAGSEIDVYEITENGLRLCDANDGEEASELIAYKTLKSLLDAVVSRATEAQGHVNDMINAEAEDPATSDEDEEYEEQVETAQLDALFACLQEMGANVSSAQTLCYKLGGPSYNAPSISPSGYEGRRHSASDQTKIQQMHDNAVALGATCAPMTAAETVKKWFRSAVSVFKGPAEPQTSPFLLPGAKIDLRVAGPLPDKAEVDCPTCDGSGQIKGKDCPTCDGTGKVPKMVAKKMMKAAEELPKEESTVPTSWFAGDVKDLSFSAAEVQDK